MKPKMMGKGIDVIYIGLTGTLTGRAIGRVHDQTPQVFVYETTEPPAVVTKDLPVALPLGLV